MRIFILRHGNTDWSDTGKHTSITDLSLNKQGEQAAKDLVPLWKKYNLKSPEVWCSPRKRAIETAELSGLKINKIEDNLSEWFYGDLEGLTTKEISKTYPKWLIWTGPVPNGEDDIQVQSRADLVLNEAKEVMKEKDLILVGHGHFSRVLVTRWIGQPISFGSSVNILPASISNLGYEHDLPIINSLSCK